MELASPSPAKLRGDERADEECQHSGMVDGGSSGLPDRAPLPELLVDRSLLDNQSETPKLPRLDRDEVNARDSDGGLRVETPIERNDRDDSLDETSSDGKGKRDGENSNESKEDSSRNWEKFESIALLSFLLFISFSLSIMIILLAFLLRNVHLIQRQNSE